VKKSLPLDDRRWLPLTKVHAELAQSLDRKILAAWDLGEKLRTGGIRSMCRHTSTYWGDAPPAPELLDKYFWRGHEIVPVNNDVFVFPLPGLPTPGRELSDFVFYVWGPDCKNIFDPSVTPAAPNPQAQEVPGERGRKPFPERTTLTVIAFALAERRKQGEPEKTQADVGRELLDWCVRNKKKVPKPTTLGDIVRAAFRIRTEWRTSRKG
jgi:hypothetical protein